MDISVPIDNPSSLNANKSQHNFVFAAWLIKTFGQEFLRRNKGVVDIAGGSGLLSFELSVRYGVSTTIIDPRSVKLNSMLRRKMRKICKAREKMKTDINNVKIDRSPLLLCMENFDLGGWENDDHIILDEVFASVRNKGGNKLPFNHLLQSFPTKVSDQCDIQLDISLFDCLNSSSILVGMHSVISIKIFGYKYEINFLCLL